MDVYREDALYSAYYKAHGFKYQIVVSACGIMEDVSGPFGGRWNDAEMVRDTLLEERLQTLFDAHDPYYIYGDPAYGGFTFIQRPLDTTTMSPGENYYNRKMASVRVSVEHAIGLVATTFPAIDFVRQEKLGLGGVGVKYLVACMMRNMMTCIRGGNQISDMFGVQPPSLSEYLRYE
mgnify:FL=1